MRILNPKIIGIVLGLGLALAQAPSTHAFYSSVLSRETGAVKQHIAVARQINGNGTWLNAMEKADAVSEEAMKNRQASGRPGLYAYFSDAVQQIFIQSFTESLADGFKLLIPAFAGMTTCLRDDIWGLQALQEEVLNELLKSSLLNDSTNSEILWRDYNLLQARLDGKSIDQITKKRILGLKNETDWTQTNVWFPGGELNYYVECPSGEITMAIKDAIKSLENVGDTLSGGGFQLGSLSQMWSIAKQRAVKKASDYIAKNQLKLSLGGSPGANPQGLVNGNGVEGLASEFKTGWERAVNTYNAAHVGDLIGAAGDFFTGSAAALKDLAGGDVTLDKALATYKEAWETRQRDLSRISNSLKFGIELNYVSGESLKDIEGKMLSINSKIKEANFQTGIPKMCEKLNTILKKQCKNKSVEEPVSCKK